MSEWGEYPRHPDIDKGKLVGESRRKYISREYSERSLQGKL